jgi:signal transduction histidine kinase
MRVFSLRAGRRRTALGRIADGVLSSPDLASLARLLTRDLPGALEAGGASLLLWDRRLESFEGLALDEGGRLVTVRPESGGPGTPGARWLLSDGQLLETASGGQEGMLVPLLARSGLAGMLVLGAAPKRRRPVSDGEARLVSIIATRAALAVENLAYQKELIASERLAALGTMAGMLVHDFRGPMTLIRGWAETLLAGDVPPEEAAARARIIVDAVDRLERMTAETLDFARGAEKLVLRSVPLGLLLAELAAGIEAELPGLCVDREFDVPGGRRGTLDVDKIRRAVSNVAANARDAMGGEGQLRFSARVVPGGDGSSDRLEIVLADDGPGVAVEIRDRVFEPFVTLGKKRGTGLGLAVARRFVEDHGGTLELLPPEAAPAKGAAFRFGLPLSPPGAAHPRAARPPGAGGPER